MDGQGAGHYFIGLSDESEEGKWVWADGSNSTWRHWASTEPNGGTQESCAVLYYDDSSSGIDGQWVDVACGDARMFVCKVSSKNMFFLYHLFFLIYNLYQYIIRCFSG